MEPLLKEPTVEPWNVCKGISPITIGGGVMKKEIWLEALNNIKLFWQGATDYNRKSKALLIKESHNEMDEFILLCFGDMLGIPLPTTYYSLELLPLLADDLEGWQFRMSGRQNIWHEKWGDYGFDA